MADHSKPLTTSTYANFVSELDARFDDLAVGLDPAVTTATNLPTNAIRWSSAANKWQKWNGTAWNDLTSTYVYPSISVTGNTTLGDASGDALTINASTVSIPNSLNFDSNTLFIDATNNRVGILDATPSYALDVGGVINSSGGVQVTGSTGNATLDSSGARLAFTRAGANYISATTAGGYLSFGSDGTESQMLLLGGNLGLGVTPSAWNSDYKVQQLGINSAVYGRVATAANTGISANTYRDSAVAQWTYISSNYATRYEQALGNHQWFIAPSGTAGSAITFTQAMTLDASGGLVLNGSGLAASPVIRIANDTNTGIYSPGTDQIGFATAGTAAMTLDASGNARIYGTFGVNDSAPVSTAAINSSITRTANSTNNSYGISNILNISNEVLTADRTTYGAYNTNGSTYQNAAAFTLTQYGSYNQAYTSTTSGNSVDGEGSLVGSYNYVLHQSDDATYKRIENGYGSYNYVYSSGDTSLIDTACGTYNYIRTAGTSASASVAITNAYGHYTIISAGAANRNITNAYGYYLHGQTQTGTITNAYGLYIAPAWSNHLAGGLTVGGTADSTLTQGIRAVGTIQGDSLFANLTLDVVGTSQFQDAVTILSSCSADTFGVGSNGAAATPSIYRTSDTNTGIFFPALDAVGVTCGGVEQFRADGTGQLWNTIQSQVGTDYTTLYKGYFCRAWVNFNGTGTVAIRASGNVSSITDNGGTGGDYTVNFTTAMPDANYATNVTCESIASGTDFNYGALSATTAQTTALVRVISAGAASSLRDSARMCISVFR